MSAPETAIPASIHASAVLVGTRAILIRGTSGAGKSRLALRLLNAAPTGPFRFTRLIGDDRIVLQAMGGRLIARGVPQLAGLIEIRGLGVRRVPFEPSGLVGLVVDFGEAPPERLPQDEASVAGIEGVEIPRLYFGPGDNPLVVIEGYLKSMVAGTKASGADASGSHISSPAG